MHEGCGNSRTMLKTCPICAAHASARETQLGETPIYACARCTHRFAENTEAVPYDDLYRFGIYNETLVESTRAAVLNGATLEQTHEPFFAHVAVKTAGRLLDIACGTGRFAYEASKRGWTAVGCDVSNSALAVARASFGGSVRFESSAADGAPRGPFDAVTAIEFLEHTAKPIETLTSLADRTASGGIIYVTVPNWGSRGVRTATDPAWIPPIHVQFFTKRSLREALRRVDRIDATAIRIGFVPRITSLFPLNQFTTNQPDGLWAIAPVR